MRIHADSPLQAEAAGADTATVGVVIEPHVMLTNLTPHPLLLKQLAVQKWAEARHALRLAPGRSKRLRCAPPLSSVDVLFDPDKVSTLA